MWAQRRMMPHAYCYFSMAHRTSCWETKRLQKAARVLYGPGHRFLERTSSFVLMAENGHWGTPKLGLGIIL